MVLEVFLRGRHVLDGHDAVLGALQEVVPSVRRSLPAFYAGLYYADLVQHTITDSDPHPRLYDALMTALRGLGTCGSSGRDSQAVTLAFQWAVLTETGYKPELGV